MVEQDCVYQDMDYLDQGSMHLLGYNENKLVAYARVIGPAEKIPEVRIGRIVSSPAQRGQGLGRAIVNEAINYCKATFSDSRIKISAQCYLDEFYRSFGFRTVGDVYLEDGIEHQAMLLGN